jgi:hypothetical protein
MSKVAKSNMCDQIEEADDVGAANNRWNRLATILRTSQTFPKIQLGETQRQSARDSERRRTRCSEMYRTSSTSSLKPCLEHCFDFLQTRDAELPEAQTSSKVLAVTTVTNVGQTGSICASYDIFAIQMFISYHTHNVKHQQVREAFFTS